jgi:hypothetical protein
MRTVLFLGKSDRRIETWARAHAALLAPSGGKVIFVAPYGENYVDGNFVFVNCFSTPRILSLEELQRLAHMSLNRALACDRSLTDYSSSTSYGSYSRYTPAQIEELLHAVGNTIAKHIREVDYCIDGLFDNFITPLAFFFAQSFGVKMYLIRLWHYWHDRFHLVDLPGYCSAAVNRYYGRYLERLRPEMYPRIEREFLAAKFRIGAFAHEGLGLRAQIVRDKWLSYERPALRNFLRRRLSRIVGSVWARGLRFTPQAARPTRYVVFALHVMPEASILGTDPEIADQFSLIRRLSLNLPAGVQILCKAHPGDRFGRDIEIGLARRLCSLHNVSLVPETEGIGSFLDDEHCLAVATINGSVALEAVMSDKPCFLFGKGLFAIADCFLSPKTDQEFFEQLRALVERRYTIDKIALGAIILSMKRASIAGTLSLKNPGTWLHFYSSLLPAIHDYHERTARRAGR